MSCCTESKNPSGLLELSSLLIHNRGFFSRLQRPNFTVLLCTPALFIVLVLCSFTKLSASEILVEEILVENGFESAKLAPFIDYYESLSPEDTVDIVQNISASSWVPAGDRQLSFGLTSSTYWFRFTLINNSASEILLDAGNNQFDHLQMYQLYNTSSGQQTLQHVAPGQSHSLFPIESASGKKVTILLKAQNRGPFYLPVRLWEKNAYYQSLSEKQVVKGIVLGIWGAVLLFNLTLFALFRHHLLFTFNGMFLFLGIHYLAPLNLFDLNSMQGAVVISFGLGLLCLCSFVDRLLNLKRIHEMGHKVLQIFSGILAFATLSYLFLSYNGTMTLLSALSIPVAFTLFFLGIIHMMQKNKMAVYAILSISLLLTGIISSSLGNLGYIATDSFINTLNLVGYMVMCITMSLVINLILMHQDPDSRLLRRMKMFDGSKTKELESALEKLSQDNDTLREYNTTDSLTGVKNRRYFDANYQKEFSRSVRESYSLSLILIDVDHFKNINDQYGHLVGDECLRKVAAGISSAVKRPGDILARYGGEEFAIVLPYVSNENTCHLAKEIRNKIKEMSIDVGGEKIHVTISVGVCTAMPTEKDLPNDLIARADSALYKAKDNGRDQVQNSDGFSNSFNQVEN